MFASLRWQALWAPALALLVAVLLLLAEAKSRDDVAARARAAISVRERLERSVSHVVSRHDRSMRRAHDALLEGRRETRDALLAPAADHYLRELDALTKALREAMLQRLAQGGARLEAERPRLVTQVDKVLEQARLVGPALATVHVASVADSPEALLLASLELSAADHEMRERLRVLSHLLRRSAMAATQEALAAPPAVPRTAWILLAVWVPLSLVLATRRLAKVGRRDLLRTGSREERAWAAHLSEHEARAVELERQVVERSRELERSAQQSRRLEHELLLARLSNDNLVNSLRAAVVATDAALVIRSQNRQAHKLLGLDDTRLGEPMESSPLFAALQAQRADAKTELSAAMNERQTLRYEGLAFSSARGELVLDLDIIPDLDESGAARGLLWVANDVTDAVRTKSQLLAAERLAAVGRISAQVAHEIRNPLSAIGLNAELLADDFAAGLPEPKRSEAQSILHAIAHDIERLTQVTEGYLQLTRLPRPALQGVDLNQVVGELAGMLRAEMRAHDIDLRLELSTPAPLALADPGQLRQALLNVLRNSREAMDQGGAITVSTRLGADGPTIRVTDEGPGIPPETLPRVFEPFFTTKPAGTGLGLSITQQIIAEHGGAIHIEPGPKGGAAVTFTLPGPA